MYTHTYMLQAVMATVMTKLTANFNSGTLNTVIFRCFVAKCQTSRRHTIRFFFKHTIAMEHRPCIEIYITYHHFCYQKCIKR